MSKQNKPAHTITLDEPLKRDSECITEIKLRSPASGELRGLSLVELGNLDVGALHTLLPRISLPSITEAEARKLCPADLVQLGMVVTDFLLPKSVRMEATPNL